MTPLGYILSIFGVVKFVNSSHITFYQTKVNWLLPLSCKDLSINKNLTIQYTYPHHPRQILVQKETQHLNLYQHYHTCIKTKILRNINLNKQADMLTKHYQICQSSNYWQHFENYHPRNLWASSKSVGFILMLVELKTDKERPENKTKMTKWP